MNYQGSTLGTFADDPTATVLSFAGDVFGLGTTSGGSAALSDLGIFTLTLPPANPAITATGDFVLSVIFTIPNGLGSVNPIVAAMMGTINKNNGNNILIDFGVGQTITFDGSDGTGSFFLTVNDVMFPQSSGTGSQQTLTGSISNAIFNPISAAAAAASVPEPPRSRCSASASPDSVRAPQSSSRFPPTQTPLGRGLSFNEALSNRVTVVCAAAEHRRRASEV
jgi:hypothetical protein